MKLYYAPGACSLSQHINLREAGLEFDLVKVDLRAKRTEDGRDFLEINPKGQVPVLERDDGRILTENPVIAEHIADLAPQSGLIPPAGTLERYRVLEWLSFVGSELHKTFGPLFRPNTPDDYKPIAQENFGRKLDMVEQHLAGGREYLANDRFSAADAYCYVVLRWPSRVGMDLSRWSAIGAYATRIAARPAVQAALKAEGLS